MGTLFSHFCETTCLACQFVFHRWYLYLFVNRGLSNQIFLVYFRYRLCPHQTRNLNFILPIISINIKILSFTFMVFVCFFLVLECIPLFINLSLRKDTWLYDDFSNWVQIDVKRVVSFFLLFELSVRWLFSFVHCIVHLADNLRVKLLFLFSCFWPEYPLRHLG